MKHARFLFVTLVALLPLGSCSKKQEPATPNATPAPETLQAAKIDTSHTAPVAITGAAEAGQKIFYSTTYGKIKVSCASCHTDGLPTTKDDHIRPGHTLVGVTSRTATWNGQFKGEALQKNAYGATMCAVMYLHKGDDMASVLSSNDIASLNAYFEAIKNNAGAITSNIKIQWVTKPALHEEDKIDETAATAAAKAIMMLPGDPDNGKTVFDRSCANCHSMTEGKAGPPLNKAMDTPLSGAKAIRCGSAAMPFFGKDILSDQQIADVIAYVQSQLGK